MASASLPQVAKTWNESSFDVDSFDYQWTIGNVKARFGLSPPVVLKTPPFFPGLKVNGYKSKWLMSFDIQGSSIALQLKMEYGDCSYAYTPKSGADVGLWGVVTFSVLKPRTGERNIESDSNSDSKHVQLYVKHLPYNYSAANHVIQTVNIPYKTDVGISNFARLDHEFLSAATYSDTLTLYCKVDVYKLSDPKHNLVAPPPQQIKEPPFDLGMKMEEARKTKLFTDVVLVAGRKEFQVHRAVLASQSTTFKAEFEKSSLTSKVVLTDSPEVLEAVISFLYTGTVPNINSKLAVRLLEAAERYQVSEIRVCCEKVLAESLDSNNVVENIVRAHTYHADQLKSACLSYIAKNPSDVQKSDAWKNFNADQQELKLEMLDAIAKSLIK